MRVKRSRAPRWTAEERAVLFEFYPDGGVEQCADLLPERSQQAIYVYASKLGLRSGTKGRAPELKLTPAQVEEAMVLRGAGWSYEKIGDHFGVVETSASNAILIEEGRRLGFRPLERDRNGWLTPASIETIREHLRAGMKACEIQRRCGVSAACVAEQRRRYRADLKARGKKPLPPPGNGVAYSGVPVPKNLKKEAEQLFMEGWGTLKICERLGLSKTTVGRVRKRLVARLGRKGETLPGCDANGVRRVQKDSTRHIPAQSREHLRQLLLIGTPVARAAKLAGIGGCSAYRIRDELAAELASRGETLLRCDWRSKEQAEIAREAGWLPSGAKAIYRFRALCRTMGAEAAKETMLAEMAAEQEAARQKRIAEAARPLSFAEKLERVRSGQVAITRRIVVVRPMPNCTLGGVASGSL